MAAEIRDASLADLPSMIDLLILDARSRREKDRALWTLAADAAASVQEAVTFSLTAREQPFRQKWLVAEEKGRLVGIVHSMRLPVPPIYAGEWGAPGLVLPECLVTPDAPSGTLEALVQAAESDLAANGASLLLAAFVCGNDLLGVLRGRGFEPLTLYLSRSGLTATQDRGDVRFASPDDVAGIVGLSARHRANLSRIDAFWTPHADADVRFQAWMTKSLSFRDRDMLVAGPPFGLRGYAIAQPASRLHFPPAHDISATGVIDDFFHEEYAAVDTLRDGGHEAASLLRAAEACFAERGVTTSFVVCPAAWASKVALLEEAGYRTAMVWMIKR